MNNDMISVTASAFAQACRERIKTVNVHTDAGASRAAMLDILADILDGAASRLSPPTAKEEGCVVVEYVDGWFGIETSDHKRFWNQGAGGVWLDYTGIYQRTIGNMRTRAEAEAALPTARLALAAAHAAGRAEQKPRAPKGCVINEDGEVLKATLVSAAPTPLNPRFYETEWLWRLTKSPAPPAADQEAGR